MEILNAQLEALRITICTYMCAGLDTRELVTQKVKLFYTIMALEESMTVPYVGVSSLEIDPTEAERALLSLTGESLTDSETLDIMTGV